MKRYIILVLMTLMFVVSSSAQQLVTERTARTTRSMRVTEQPATQQPPQSGFSDLTHSGKNRNAVIFPGQTTTVAKETVRPSRQIKRGDLSNDKIDVYGYVSSSQSGLKPGLYRLPRNATDTFQLVNGNFTNVIDAVLVGDTYYTAWERMINPAARLSYHYYEAYNIHSGERLMECAFLPLPWRNGYCTYGGLSHNPIDDKFYGIFNYPFSDSSKNFGRIEKLESDETPQFTQIAKLPENFAAIAINMGGVAYVVNRSGDLYTINLSNGILSTMIGDTGILSNMNSGSMVFDESGRLFFSTKNAQKAALYEINPATAEATLLIEYPGKESIRGIFTLPRISDKAPGKATDLTATFAPGEKSGSFSFIAPTTLNDGSLAAGDIHYRVFANEQLIGEGTTQYGTKVSLPSVSVNDRGNVSFSVILSNNAGNGPKAVRHCSVGYGVPRLMEPLLAKPVSNGVKVWWPRITKANSGDTCLFKPEEVTYTVYRSIDGADYQQIATGLKDTTYIDVFPHPETSKVYKYSVKANFRTETSKEIFSNHISFGYNSIPYVHDFTASESLVDWNIYDLNWWENFWTTWQYTNNDPYIGLNGCGPKGHDHNDDWLISKLFRLKGGKAYYFSFDASILFGKSSIQAYYGNGINPESMTHLLIDTVVTKIGNLQTGIQVERFSGYITPDHDMSAAIGIYSNSDQVVYVHRVELSEGIDAHCPATVSGLKAKGSKDLKVTLNFKAPEKDLAGNALTNISKIEILRGDSVLVGTVNSTSPGASVEKVIADEPGGYNSYTVIAYSSYGKGAKANTAIWTGFAIPKTTGTPEITETATPGTVRLSWHPVTTTELDEQLTSQDVWYNIARIENNQVGEMLLTNVRDTCAIVKLQNPDEEQAFESVCIQAVTNGGGSAWYGSDYIPVGKLYTDYYQKFKDGGYDGYVTAFQKIGDDYRTTGTAEADSRQPDAINSVDGDGGYLFMRTPVRDAAIGMMSGKINLSGMTNPMLTFYANTLYEESFDAGANVILVRVREPGGEWVTLLSNVSFNSLGTPGWNFVPVDLSQFKGKTVQFVLAATCVTTQENYFDDIRIWDVPQNDIAALNLTVPSHARRGEVMHINALVGNNGKTAATNVPVELLYNGNVITSQTIEKIEAFKTARLTFDVELPVVDSTSVDLQIRVMYNDEIADNNLSVKRTVAVKGSELPGVSRLEGESLQSSTKLWWSAPQHEDIEWTYDFEEGYPGETEYANWTFIDADQYPVAGLTTIKLPGITAGFTKASFFLMEEHGSSLTAHSGIQCLGNMCRYDIGRVDDWAISPELNGDTQTITFWAKNVFAEDGRRGEFSVYYSTTGKNIDDFKVVEGTGKYSPSDQWTQIEVNVPAGTKYFAVHSTGKGAWMQLFDDFNMFIKGPKNYTLKGYNVYRDGQKLNENLFTSLNFSDNQPLDGVHVYAVIPMFDLGAGRPTFKSMNNGVNGITKEVLIGAEAGSIIVEGAENQKIQVTAADGKVLFLGTGSERNVIPAQPGVYVVRVDGLTVKVLVK